MKRPPPEPNDNLRGVTLCLAFQKLDGINWTVVKVANIAKKLQASRQVAI